MKKNITHQEYKDALLIVNLYRFQVEEHLKEVKEETKNIGLENNNIKHLHQTNCSVFLYNRIVDYINSYTNSNYILPSDSISIDYLKDFNTKKFLKIRCVGKKTLEELKLLCLSLNIELF
jgi:hypothetical protein